MNDFRKSTFREQCGQWAYWVQALACNLRYTFRQSWNDRPDGQTPVFVTCRKCGSRCTPSKDGDCYFC